MDYTVRKINDRIYTFEEEGVRSFLIIGEDAALVIDTGYGAVDYIGEIMERTELPVMLVTTHSDGDHVGGNNQFADVPCYAHPAEIPALETEFVHYLPCSEGFVFDLGGIKLEVIHTPGHTPGSISLLCRECGTLFSGDMVSEATIWMFGDNRNMQDFIASQKKLAKIEGIKQIFPCHGELPVKAEGIFEELAALAQSVVDGTARWEPEVLAWDDVTFNVRRNFAGRVSMYTSEAPNL